MVKDAAKRAAGQIVTRTQLAELVGITLSTVDNWVRAGCPVISRGGRGGVRSQFDTAAVIAWREERALEAATKSATAEELKRRRMVAITELAELDLAKARGEVAPVEQFERALSGILAEVRQGLRIIPDRVPRMIVGESDERRIKDVLRAEIDNALKALAEGDLLAEVDLDEDPE